MSQFNYKEIIEGQLPLDLYKSRDLESQAMGNSLNKLQSDVDRLEEDVNPLTAKNKGLERWETFFKLPSNIEESIEIRRARVISEFIQFMSDENVIRKDEMESIVGLYTDECEIEEHFSDYIFDVILKVTGQNYYSMNLNEIHKVIKKLKPAWLDYRLSMILKPKQSNIYIASALISAEEITVYPYSPKNIESKGNIYVAIGSNAGVENMTVYPRKEVI